jgi:threonylcarbamoyladenosine tRNA methylthiotransferase CDKAL1
MGGNVKVCVETYGCTMNQGEGAMLAEKLASLGHEVIDNAADADLVVLNTCTVIRETENRMLKRMSELSGQRKKLIVAGCMASVQPDEIVKRAPQALIIAPRDYAGFEASVRESFGPGEGNAIALMRSPTVTAVLPVAQGCVGNCSYCITRQARGMLSSYSVESVAANARKALDAGARELLVTAQDTACYGFDRGQDLSDLLRAITALEGDFMVRVGMMNPDNLARVIGRFVPSWTSPKVYQFIHLPVQSGSDAVLEGMNRGYTVAGFEALVSQLRINSPDMVLSTDVITGFPGETEEDQQATVELLKRVRPEIVNVTRFSPRPGTPAAKARNQVAGWVSKERSRELTKLRFDIARGIHERMVGRTDEVLITEVGKPGTMIGRTASYRPVVVAKKVPLGSRHKVIIAGAEATHLLGDVV